jgi:hypothetical protein
MNPASRGADFSPQGWAYLRGGLEDTGGVEVSGFLRDESRVPGRGL